MITVGIASIPARVDSLKNTLLSIHKQVNIVHVSLNGYTEIPKWAEEFSNVEFIIKHVNMGDAEKFFMAHSYHGYYLALDDDLEVHPNYVEYMCKGVDEYNGLVSLHGKKYLAPVRGYKQWAGNYRCLDLVSEDVHVNLIGSGCCAFHTDRLNVSMGEFKRENMADVFISKIASDQGVPMMVLKHDKGYLNYLYPQGRTIWQDTHDYSYHIKVMNTFIK